MKHIESFFREQALAARLTDDFRGEAVRITPPWSWTVLVVALVLVGASSAFAFLGRIEVVSRARAVLRPESGLRILRAPAAGTAIDMQVRSGQRVRAGETLLRVAEPQTESAFLEAKRQLEFLQAAPHAEEELAFEQQIVALTERLRQNADQIASLERSLARAAKAYEAQVQLEKGGLVSSLALDTARDAYDQIGRQLSAAREASLQSQQQFAAVRLQQRNARQQREQALSAARARLSALQIPKQNTVVTAPTGGRIESLTIRPGDLLQAGQEIAKIIPGDARLLVVAFLPEKDRAFVKPGDIERLEFDRYPYMQFGTMKGRVLSVSDEPASLHELTEAFGDSAALMANTCRVELELVEESAQREFQLTSGMSMNVRFTLRREKPIMLLWAPVRALFD